MNSQKFRTRLLFLITVLAVLPLLNTLYYLSYQDSGLFYIYFILMILVLIGSITTVINFSNIFSNLERQIRNDKIWQQSYLEGIHDGFFHLDSRGKILELNTALSEMFRYSTEFLVGKNLWDYLSTQKGDIPKESWFYNQLGTPISRLQITMVAKRKTGQNIPVLVELLIQRENKTVTGYYGFVTSIARQFAENHIRQETLFALYQKIADDLQIFDLALQSLPRDYQKTLQHFRTEVLSRLNPEYLKELYKILRREPVDFVVITQELKKWAEPLAHLRGQHLIFEIPSVDSIIGVGDAEKIYLALKNILHNALKYAPADGMVKLEMIATEQETKFIISDNGEGIARSEQMYMVYPFFRPDTETNVKTSGLGFGLWLARHFIEAHQGNFQIESAPGKGTKVFVVIPRRYRQEISDYRQWQEKRFLT